MQRYSWLPLLMALGGAAFPPGAHAASSTTLIATGAVWKYLDSGVDPGPTWRGLNFEDTTWPSGPAQLGYGDGDETTLIAEQTPKPVTVYFRHTFVLTNAQPLASLTARLLRDDGAVVYVNGYEIFRNNMPGTWNSPVAATDLALTSLSGVEETRFIQRGAYYVWPGTNVVAVEIHQSESGGHDCSFDLELVGGLPITPPTVVMTSPQDGAELPLDSIELVAGVSDLDGHVYQVEFFVNSLVFGGTRSIGWVAEEPFSLTWMPPGWGRFAIWARAVDNSGRSAVSATAHITVGSVESIALTRGPYLQSGSTTSVVVRWRTDWFADAWVRIGTSPDNLTAGFTNEVVATEHEVRLTGLAPGTRYYYAVGYADRLLAAGEHLYFVTAPATNRPTRIWAIGDFGTADTYQGAVRDAYAAMEQSEGKPTDFWLMLGDNAYEVGTDEQYQAAVFDIYGPLLHRAVVWPTLGNHDAGSAGVNEAFPYLEIFSLPRQGEAGGIASGTERFYSFDHGDIHVVCLDSQSSDRHPGSPMLNWLEQDLAATTKDWILAFWHHPPYSFGTHNSDWELQMIEMRQHILPMLETFGVDVVLTGHSHVYERSYLLNGHYGSSMNLAPSMILDAGSGQEHGDGAYRKPAGGMGAHQGTVYVVCGCSGQGGFFDFARHPAKAVNLSGFGSVVLDIDGLRLDARFLSYEGNVVDGFTLLKGAPAPEVRPELHISRRDADQAQVAWPTSLIPYALERSTLLGVGAAWTPVTLPHATLGRSNVVAVPLSGSNAVFRLRAEP